MIGVLLTDDVGRSSIPSSTAGPTVKTSPTSHDHGPTPPDKHEHAAASVEGGRKKGKCSCKGV